MGFAADFVSRTFIAVALAVALVGCGGYSQQVTPWLRTARDVPFRVLGEPGSPGDESIAERRENGRWVRVPGLGDEAFAFAGGTRAVVKGDALDLVRPEGPPVRIDCEGEVRGTPDGANLVCIEVRRRTGTPPQTVRVAWLDADARVVSRNDVPYPVVIADSEPIPGADADPDLLGFLPEGLVFAVLVQHGDESFAGGTVKQLRAFLLGADWKWRELGSLTITVEQLWALHFPGLWNDTNRWRVEPGRRLHDAKGEPFENTSLGVGFLRLMFHL